MRPGLNRWVYLSYLPIASHNSYYHATNWMSLLCHFDEKEKRALTNMLTLSSYPWSHYSAFCPALWSLHETTYNQPFQQNHHSLFTMSSSTTLTQYLWIAIAGVIFGFIYCFSIGANDVANAFVSLILLSLSICACTCIVGHLTYSLQLHSIIWFVFVHNRRHLLLLNQ